MNLEELQTARDRERQTDKLQQLRESFYTDAGEFIQQLRAERDRAAERAEDPFDAPEVNQLTDEINTAEQTVEAIYEKRVGKIVKAASFAAADLPAEADGMTAEEQELFETLVDNIKGNREMVMAALDGDPQPETEPEPTSEEGTGVSAADLMGAEPDPPVDSGQERSPGGESGPDQSETPAPGSDTPPAPDQGTPPVETRETTGDNGSNTPTQSPPPEPADRIDHSPAESQQTTEEGTAATHQGEPVRNDGGQPDVERQTVRVTDDIETFVGSDDRDYDLSREDIVRLPEPNATLLLERDAAERL